MDRDTGTTRSDRRLWRREGGLLLPAGRVVDVSRTAATTLVSVKQRAIQLERLFGESRVRLPEESSLAALIAHAKAVSDAWLLGRDVQHKQLFAAITLDRITHATLPLRDLPDRAPFLRRLTRGSLDLLARTRSQAKDVLWELELWASLRRRQFNARLCEPPDIVVDFSEGSVGMACKKLYSTKNVPKVLSEAVDQIEPIFDLGVVAMNLDDLLPPDALLKVENHKVVGERLARITQDFLTEFQRYFLKYLNSSRVVAAFVSTAVLADLFRQRVRFNNVRQSVIWTIPGLAPEKRRAVRHLYDGMFGTQ